MNRLSEMNLQAARKVVFKCFIRCLQFVAFIVPDAIHSDGRTDWTGSVNAPVAVHTRIQSGRDYLHIQEIASTTGRTTNFNQDKRNKPQNLSHIGSTCMSTTLDTDQLSSIKLAQFFETSIKLILDLKWFSRYRVQWLLNQSVEICLIYP